MLMLMSEQMCMRHDTNSMWIEGKLELISTMYNITEILQKLSIVYWKILNTYLT